MRIRRRGPALRHPGILAAAVCLLTVTAPAAGAAEEPSQWLGLAGGQVGEFEWSVKVKRPASAGGAGEQRPCLMVGTKWELSSYSFRRSRFRTCADASTKLTPQAPPLIASGVQPSTGRQGITAVGILVAPAVRRVAVTLANGRRTVIRLDRLTPEQARRARIRRFRYAAFVVRGIWCADRLATLNARGRVLWDSGSNEYTCGAVFIDR
jgi:hypothetical protein